MDPILTVRFVTADDQCVNGYAQHPPLSAEQHVTLTVGRLAMSGDENIFRYCSLPITTTKLLVQFWERQNPRAPLLTEEIAYAYTFDNQ